MQHLKNGSGSFSSRPVEEPDGILTGNIRHLFHTHLPDRCQHGCHVGDIGGLIPLPAIGNRCQIRGIGLEKNPLPGTVCDCSGQAGIFKRDHPVDANHELFQLKDLL